MQSQRDKSSITSEAHLNALGSIGLSPYESKCLLASLQSGPSTIKQIGIMAGIPRTKVYGAVKRLVERGLIEQSEEDSKIYIARSPRDFLIPLLEKENERIKEGLEALTELEVIHQSMEFVKKAESLRSKVLRYSPRDTISRKIKDLFEGSTKKVVILSSANGLIRLSRLTNILYERAIKGTEVIIFSAVRDEPVFANAVQSFNEIEGCKVSLLSGSVPVQIIIIDTEYTLVIQTEPDDVKEEEGADVAFLIQNHELAEMMESLVPFIGTGIRNEPVKKIL